MGIFVFNDIYNKTKFMKIILTESQYNTLQKYINEVRQAKPAISLKELFGKNPNATYFSVSQQIKGGSETDYFFKISKSSHGTGMIIEDMNPGTNTGTKHGKRKGCQTDARLDTMLHGNKFTLSFGQCGTLNLNNITIIKLYSDEEAAKSGDVLDSMELEHDLNKSNEELLDKYHDMLGNLKVDQHIYLDSKHKWDGVVTRKSGNIIQIELYQHGIPDNLSEADMEWDVPPEPQPNQPKNKQPKKKKVKKPLTIEINLDENPFYEKDGQIHFKTKAYDKYTGKDIDFDVPIKKVDTASGGAPEEKPQQKPEVGEKPIEDLDDEEMVSMGKEAMDMIVNDPDLKRAFYKHPNLWQLIKAEINGKKAPGTGILPTLQLIDKIGSNKMIDNFEPNQSAKFTPYNKPISLSYGQQTFKLNVGEEYTIMVKEYSLENKEDYTLLEDKKRNFRIIVKRKADKLEGVSDVYICNLQKGFNTGDGIEWVTEHNAYIKFMDSDGYKAENRANKEETKSKSK